MLVSFYAGGSASSLELKTNYVNTDRVYVRKTVDSKRISGEWKALAWHSDIKNPTDYYWANVKVSSSSNEETTPTFKTASVTNYITTPYVTSTGRLTLNATNTGLDLKFNNDNTKSVILNGTAFKPFDASDNKLTLGSTTARWSTIYGYTGDFSTKINTPRIDGYDTSGVYLV